MKRPDRAERISLLIHALKRGILFSNHNDTLRLPSKLSVWSPRTSGGARRKPDHPGHGCRRARISSTSWAASFFRLAKNASSRGGFEPGKLA